MAMTSLRVRGRVMDSRGDGDKSGMRVMRFMRIVGVMGVMRARGVRGARGNLATSDRLTPATVMELVGVDDEGHSLG